MVGGWWLGGWVVGWLVVGVSDDLSGAQPPSDNSNINARAYSSDAQSFGWTRGLCAVGGASVAVGAAVVSVAMEVGGARDAAPWVTSPSTRNNIRLDSDSRGGQTRRASARGAQRRLRVPIRAWTLSPQQGQGWERAHPTTPYKSVNAVLPTTSESISRGKSLLSLKGAKHTRGADPVRDT